MPAMPAGLPRLQWLLRAAVQPLLVRLLCVVPCGLRRRRAPPRGQLQPKLGPWAQPLRLGGALGSGSTGEQAQRRACAPSHTSQGPFHAIEWRRPWKKTSAMSASGTSSHKNHTTHTHQPGPGSWTMMRSITSTSTQALSVFMKTTKRTHLAVVSRHSSGLWLCTYLT